MSSRYDWICSSEDSVHYDTEDIIPLGAYLFLKSKLKNEKPPREPREEVYLDLYLPTAFIKNIF